MGGGVFLLGSQICSNKMNILKKYILFFGGCVVWMLACNGWAQESTFDILEYRVKGVTLLTNEQVEDAVYKYMGPGKSLGDIQKANDELEKKYHQNGFLTVVVSIPQQKVENGIVELQVTEAPVGRLRVKDSNYFSPSQIKATVPSVAEGKVPDFAQFQEELAELNRTADRRVTPVLKAGREPGSTDIDLMVEDKVPLHGSLEVNNRFTPPGNPTHASAGLHWDNLWGLQHTVGITVQTVPENVHESSVYTLNYSVPYANGDDVSFYAVNSNSNILYSSFNTLNISSGKVYGARLMKNLTRNESLTQSATLGIDYKQFDQTTASTAGGGFNTPITYMPMLLGWDGSMREEFRNLKVNISLNFHSSQFVGSDVEFADKAYKAHASYAFLKGNFERNDVLSSGFGWNFRTNWQLATAPLISNEQFFIGGADTVRGYTESIAAGDSGIAATFEVVTPNLIATQDQSGFGLLNEIKTFAFIDAGSVKLVQAYDANSESIQLVGTGFGVRAKGKPGLGISADMGWAQRPVTNTTPTVSTGDFRAHLRLTLDW
jgi:hemolysin activation/secretion protein